jgi:hypothetical protein
MPGRKANAAASVSLGILLLAAARDMRLLGRIADIERTFPV